MLSIGKMSGGQSRYYCELAREDYYLYGGEPVGHWFGQGAERLALRGEVEAHQLALLFDGFSPEGNPLVQNAGRDKRRPGFDLTFSAPKSLSVFWAMCDSETRREIQQAQDAAVRAALSYLEQEAGWIRTGKGGSDYHKAGTVVAIFEHGTSRALDPQLHTHALLMNMAVTELGVARALVHPKFFDLKMVAGAIYRAELAAQLGQRCGLRIEPDRKNGFSFVVSKVSESLCEFFSKRRAEIEKVLGRDGLESAKAAEIAAKDTRDIKEIVPPRSELFEQWQKIGEEFHFAREEAFGLVGNEPVRHPQRELTKAFDEAVTILGESHSHFTKTELLQQVAESAIGKGIGYSTIRDGFEDQVKKNDRIVGLGIDKAGAERFAVRDNLKAEESLLKNIDELKENRRHGVGAQNQRAVLKHSSSRLAPLAEELKHHAKGLYNAARYRRSTPPVDRDELRAKAAFNPTIEQRAAVRHLTARGGGAVRCLVGDAGTGKTTTLGLTRQVWEKGGYRVIGVTLSGKAAEELQKGAQIKSFTYAMLTTILKDGAIKEWSHHARQLLRAAQKKPTFKYKPFKLDNKSVLVVDEAAMLDTHQLAHLADRVRSAGAMLVLTGDRKQLQAIGPGGAFGHIVDTIGSARLTTIIRQRDPQDRDMVTAVRSGDAQAALDSLSKRELLNIADNRSQAIERLVADWVKGERNAKPGSSLIFVNTNAEAREINQLCQKGLMSEGRLGEKHLRINQQNVHVNDRVLLGKTRTGMGVNNGDTGTVLSLKDGIFDRGITVRLDKGKTVYLSSSDYHKIGLGYAVTTHKGQGSTIDRAYILAGGKMQDREISYVQASRARGTTRVYTSKHEVGEKLERLARAMARSNEKTLASSLHDQSDQRETEQQELRQRLRQREK